MKKYKLIDGLTDLPINLTSQKVMVIPSNPVSQAVNHETKRTSIPMGVPLLKSSEKAQQKVPLDRLQPDLISMMPHSARSIKSSAHSVSSSASGKIEFD